MHLNCTVYGLHCAEYRSFNNHALCMKAIVTEECDYIFHGLCCLCIPNTLIMMCMQVPMCVFS